MILPNFLKNCMKLKEFGLGGHLSFTPPQIRHCEHNSKTHLHNNRDWPIRIPISLCNKLPEDYDIITIFCSLTMVISGGSCSSQTGQGANLLFGHFFPKNCMKMKVINIDLCLIWIFLFTSILQGKTDNLTYKLIIHIYVNMKI